MVSDFPLEYVLSHPVKLVGLGCDAPPVNNLVDLVFQIGILKSSS